MAKLKLDMTCADCAHHWSQKIDTAADEFPGVIEPEHTLKCPSCGAAPPPRPAEDFCSALEDLLAQTAWLSRSISLSLEFKHDPAS